MSLHTLECISHWYLSIVSIGNSHFQTVFRWHCEVQLWCHLMSVRWRVAAVGLLPAESHRAPVQTRAAVSLRLIQSSLLVSARFIWAGSCARLSFSSLLFGLSLCRSHSIDGRPLFASVTGQFAVHPSFSCKVKLKRNTHISIQWICWMNVSDYCGYCMFLM